MNKLINNVIFRFIFQIFFENKKVFGFIVGRCGEGGENWDCIFEGAVWVKGESKR